MFHVCLEKFIYCVITLSFKLLKIVIILTPLFRNMLLVWNSDPIIINFIYRVDEISHYC